MDSFTAVACVTASLATVWCVSEVYLRYVYSKKVVLGMVPSNSRRSRRNLFYGTTLDSCQEMTSSYAEDRAERNDESLPPPLEAIVIVEESKPPPYDQCITQESEPPPYVECLPEE